MGVVSRRGFLAGAAGMTAAGLAGPVRSLALALVPPGSPFTHGVASGDPSVDGVVLWTRLDPATHHGATVLWEVFPNGDASNVLRSGTAVVSGDRDGTVQVLADGLPAGAGLGYRFALDGGPAVEGRTRTLPANPTSLRIGVTSCGKYSDGWFNAYRELAGMNCDLVLHLGDYIYASASGGTDDPLGRWNTIEERRHQPDEETRELEQYRTRYRLYRADPDLQALHAAVPVVAVWDDNDIANNSYRDGNAQGEPPEVWFPRKRAGQQAWSEYHPTRVAAADVEGNLTIWRRIRAGDLLDLVMLDTRLQRDQQVSNAAATNGPANDDPNRSMLGSAQRTWLLDEVLADSDAAWRVIGQGIVMTHWRVVGTPESIGALRNELPLVPESPIGQRLSDGGVYWNSDGWDGYAYERARLFEAFDRSGPVIVLTGDVHSSWANELVPDANPLNAPVGVEFVAPAASTRPFASNVYGLTPAFEAAFTAANPWIKYCDMDANGFLVVDLDEDRAVARWFQVDATRPGATATPLIAWASDRETRRLLPHVG